MSTSKLSKVTVGGLDAPNHSKFIALNSSIAFSYGNVLDGITIDGVHTGGQGAKSASLTLKDGEYWKAFTANSNPNYYGGVVTSIEFITNLGRSVAANVKGLPKAGDEPVAVVIDDCLIYGIELISGDFINQMTIHYIEKPMA